MPLEVPSYSLALPDGVDPPALVSFLAERFDIAADAAAPLAFTVVDTADRRLRAAGADVTLHNGRAGATLVLREQVGAAPLSAEVRRRKRWLVGDLPAGPFRDRLAPIIEMRALLPPARARVDAQPLRVRNADAKTVVRLRLTRQAALDTGGDPAPLTPRVEVTGVLGYPRPLARVVAALTTEAGLVDAPESMADEAIAASGGDPEGIRSKVRVDLRRDQRTDKAAVAVLRDLAGMVGANLPGTLADAPTCSAEQMTRILEGAGYAVPRRGRGSHLRLAAKGRAVAFVPVEGPLSPTATARLLALVDATPAYLPALLAPS